MFQKNIRSFSCFLFLSLALKGQPIDFSIQKIKTFQMKDGNLDYDLRINTLEAPDAFSKQSILLEIKNKAELKFGKAIYNGLNRKSLKTTADDPLIIDELGMKRVFAVNGAQIPLPGGTPNDNTVAFSKDSILLGAVNSILWAWDLKTDTFHFPQQFVSLIQASGVSTSANASDPRLLYDPVEDRWILLFFVGNTPASSKIVVCFSESNDPAEGWHLYTLPGNPLNNNRWSDFPSISLSENKLVMSINLIIPGVSWQLGFDGTVIWEMDKIAGFSGESILPSQLHHGIKYEGEYIRNLVAVKGWDGQVSKAMFASNRNFSIQNDTAFFLTRSDSAVGLNHSYVISMCPTTIPYGVPPNGKQPITSGSDTYDLSTNDARWLGAIETPDNRVHLVGTTRDFSSNRCAIYHGIIENPDSPDSLDGKIISHPSRDLAYPNIAFVGNEKCDEEILIGFNHSSINEFAGFSAIYQSNDASYSDILTLKQGEGIINKLSGPERWGDYFGLQTVYHDPQKVWAAGFYGLINGGNSTWFTLLNSPDSSMLKVEMESSGIGCGHLLSANVFGGVQPYRFFWNDVEGLSSIDNLCSGDSINLEVFDERDCSVKLSYYIPFADISAPSIFPNPSLGQATLVIDAPNNGYLFVRLVSNLGEITNIDRREVRLGRNEVYLWFGHMPAGQYTVQAIFSSNSELMSQPENVLGEKIIIIPQS